MGTNIGRGDNIMREMAREVNLVESDRRREADMPISPAKRKAGIIAFGCVAALIVVILLLFVIL